MSLRPLGHGHAKRIHGVSVFVQWELSHMKRNTNLKSHLELPQLPVGLPLEPQLPPPVTPLSPQPGPGKHPLLCLHIFWPLRVSKSFAEVTLSHLVWANILLLLFKGVMQTVDLLGLDTHLDGFGCEGVFDLHGVRCRLALPTTRPSAFRAACASASSSR